MAGPLQGVRLPAYETHSLSNGMAVHCLPYGTAEVVQVQLVFHTGTAAQPKTGLATYAPRMMQEGSTTLSSLELAQKLDEHGAWLGQETGEQDVAFVLSTLSHHLPKVLPLLVGVAFEPTFPEREFANMKERDLQQMQVKAKRTAFHARRNFGHLLFGEDHPYGRHLGESELKAVSLEDLKGYYRDFLRKSPVSLLVVGTFDQAAVLQQLESLLGGYAPSQEVPAHLPQLQQPLAPQRGQHFQQVPGTQATLRLGHLGFARSHPDFYDVQVLTTLFGGFFGSRLMKNIREEKGYTYGIFASWVSMQQQGYLVIQTDVAHESIKATIQEVHAEMQRLREEPPPEEELSLVKNYLLGKTISQRETPFQLASILRFSLTSGVSFEQIDQKFDVIQSMTPERIQQLAQRHYQPDQLLEVICGEWPKEETAASSS